MPKSKKKTKGSETNSSARRSGRQRTRPARFIEPDSDSAHDEAGYISSDSSIYIEDSHVGQPRANIQDNTLLSATMNGFVNGENVNLIPSQEDLEAAGPSGINLPVTGPQSLQPQQVAGTLLDPKIKEKVWSGSYLDLASIGTNSEPSYQFALNDTHSAISTAPMKSQSVTNIFVWLRLFLIYVAVYVQRHVTEAPALMTYIQRIFELQRQYGGFVWRTYDEQFRRLRAHCPTLAWQTINCDIAMRAIHAQNSPVLQTRVRTQQPFRVPQSSNRIGSQQQQKRQSGVCNKFNNTGFCTFGQRCRYRHVCSSFGNPNHPKIRCNKPNSVLVALLQKLTLKTLSG